MEVKVQVICRYNGHSVKSNGNIDLSLKTEYGELANSIQLTQMLNNDINLIVKPAEKKAIKIGIFRLKQLRIDHDGVAVIGLNSITDYVEVDNVNTLVSEDLFKARMVAEIEEEDVEDLQEGDNVDEK